MNITIADFVVGLVCMPLRATVNLYDGWNFGQVLGILFIGFQNSILSVSVCGVVVICIDRYIATFYPIKTFPKEKYPQGYHCEHLYVDPILWNMDLDNLCLGFHSSKWRTIRFGLAKNELFSNQKRQAYSYSSWDFAVPFLLITGLYLRIYFRVKAVYRRRFGLHFEERLFWRARGKQKPTTKNINNSASKTNDEDAPSQNRIQSKRCYVGWHERYSNCWLKYFIAGVERFCSTNQ